MALVVGDAANGGAKAWFRTWGNTKTWGFLNKIINYGATSYFWAQTPQRPDIAIEAPAIININIQ